jgi:hypothetical protein
MPQTQLFSASSQRSLPLCGEIEEQKTHRREAESAEEALRNSNYSKAEVKTPHAILAELFAKLKH